MYISKYFIYVQMLIHNIFKEITGGFSKQKWREKDPEDKGNLGAASFNQVQMRKHLHRRRV